MKKKFLCLLLGIVLCLSFVLPMYAIDGPINADDDATLITPTLEVTIIPTGAAAVAHNLNTNQTYYYRINGNILPSANGNLCEPGWMPEVVSTNDIFGNDDRGLVANTQTSPYSAIAFVVIMYASDPQYWCYGTATMISPNVAITAAHILYNRDYGWPIAVRVYPGMYGSMRMPYGGASATELAISAPYFDHENSQNYNNPFWGAEHDWGVIRLDSNIGNTCGYLGFQCGNNATNLSVMLSGYPGDLNGYSDATHMFSTYNQYNCYGEIDSDTLSTETYINNTAYEKRILAYEIDATDGQSGAPILDYSSGTYRVIGVHSCRITVRNQFGDITYIKNEGCGLTSQTFHFLIAFKSIST